jgi:hypothetical protein
LGGKFCFLKKECVCVWIKFTQFTFITRISNIDWCKNSFWISDLNLKILRDDSSCPGASQVIKWVKGCFDALDKKYVGWK